MYYCEGKYCSRKDRCAHHESFDWKYPRQYLDMSTEGRGYGGIDENGKLFWHHEYSCGDKAEFYKRYKALGWREGQEYRNSKGTICDEVCLTCPHQSLCFTILEYAGMTFEEGDRIRFDCERIKNDPEGIKQDMEIKIKEWKKRKDNVNA